MKEIVIKSKIVGRGTETGPGRSVASIDLSAYALKSDLLKLETSFNDFLQGEDTDDVINRWKELETFLGGISESYNLLSILQGKADKATTLSGYGITDAYTKTNVDDLLKSYVTLAGSQTITGEKNFTGGLKVNGRPIVYDSSKKYWKLEGDLLVTGGVTMYGSDSSFTPSTIMDAILYDDTTLGINSNGQLYVKGGTSGGGLDITALQNYLTQNSYLNVTSGDNRYLKLSGGTITGTANVITINRTDLNQPCISYEYNGTSYGSLGLKGYGDPFVYNASTKVLSQIYHKGNISTIKTDLGLGSNAYTSTSYLPSSSYTAADILSKLKTVDGSSSGLDADLLDGQEGSWYRQNVLGFARHNYTNNTASERDANAVTDGMLYNYGSTNYWKNTPSGLSYGQILSLSSANDSGLMGQLAWDINNASTSDTTRTLWWRGIQSKDNISYAKWHQIAFTDSNVASATKLQTARTIWGQNFDGTGNIDGVLTLNQSTQYASIKINSTYSTLPQSFITFQAEGVDKGNVGWTQASGTHLYNATARTTLELTNGGELRYGDPGNGVLVWHADNSNLSTVDWKVSNLYCYCGGTSRQFVVSQKSYTWNGDTTLYPLIGATSVQDNQIYTMIAFPHIPFLKNGSRGYSGNSFGSMVRFEGSTSNANIWDIGCPASSENAFFIKCNDRNIASWGDTGLMGIYVPNQWLSNSMLVLGRKDSSLMTNQYAQIGITDGNLHLDAYKGKGIYLNFYQSHTGVVIDKDCNLLVSGGITMYSDQRKKTILNHVELSLKQIANAPLIEHYYNSDEKKTTHVGSIAQYWYGINDWFCKQDAEGYYTMEIQNAALASAISIARELDRYETKTDKAIKKLKKRICELEEEVERLKSA